MCFLFRNEIKILPSCHYFGSACTFITTTLLSSQAFQFHPGRSCKIRASWDFPVYVMDLFDSICGFAQSGCDDGTDSCRDNDIPVLVVLYIVHGEISKYRDSPCAQYTLSLGVYL